MSFPPFGYEPSAKFLVVHGADNLVQDAEENEASEVWEETDVIKELKETEETEAMEKLKENRAPQRKNSLKRIMVHPIDNDEQQ